MVAPSLLFFSFSCFTVKSQVCSEQSEAGVHEAHARQDPHFIPALPCLLASYVPTADQTFYSWWETATERILGRD